MNQGKTQFGAAAALVADVPTTFRYVTTHTNAQNRQWNGVSAFITRTDGARGSPLPGRRPGP